MAEPLGLTLTVSLSPENLAALADALVPYLPAAPVVDPPVDETPDEPPTEEPPAEEPPVDEEPPTQEPPTTTPPVVVVEPTDGMQPLTHGREATTANTGHTGYFDDELRRPLTDDALIVYDRKVSLSDFGLRPGDVFARRWFKAGIVIDVPDVLLLGGRSNTAIRAVQRMRAHWFTIDPAGGPGFEDGVFFDNYELVRCQIGGGSDGLKLGGNCTVEESYIRVRQLSTGDHNDGIQNSGGSGPNVVRRTNVDCRPVNAPGAYGNAAIFIADGATGLQTIEDNLLAGGQYTLRCHESATYIVQGNDIVKGTYKQGPFLHSNAPSRSFQWATERPNRVVTETGELVSIISLD